MEKISITSRRKKKQSPPSSNQKNIKFLLPEMDEPMSERQRCILSSLVPIFKEIVNWYYTGNRKYMIEIVSGYEKPFRVVISSTPSSVKPS